MRKTIHYIDMFAGMGGFREGLTRAGNFVCMGHCEIDKYADRSYRALFDTEGEWFIDDARKADPKTMPEFDLLCGGFPCQAYAEEKVIPKFKPLPLLDKGLRSKTSG